MSDLTTAAAVIGSALAVGKPVVETGCRLIESLLGEPCKVAGNLLADQVYAWQWKNRVTTFSRAKQIMDESGIPPGVLPKGFLLPALDACGNVEETELQEMWAQLIASSVAEPKHQHPSFIRILAQLSRNEAVMMSGAVRFFRNEGSSERHQCEPLWSWLTQNIPNATELRQSETDFSGRLLFSLGLGSFGDLSRMFEHMIKLPRGSVTVHSVVPMPEDVSPYPASEEQRVHVILVEHVFSPTAELGKVFLDACLPKNTGVTSAVTPQSPTS